MPADRTHRTFITVEYDGEKIVWFGRRAQLSLKSNSWLISGRGVQKLAERYQGIYSPTPFMPKDECKHLVTMCEGCQESWSWDYAILFFSHHGDPGYCQGCRCQPCIEKRWKWLSDKQRDTAKRVNIRARLLDHDPERSRHEFSLRDVCSTCMKTWPYLCHSHKPSTD